MAAVNCICVWLSSSDSRSTLTLLPSGPLDQTLHLLHHRRGLARRIDHRARHFAMEIDVQRFVPGRIDVGDVARDQRLPRGGKVQIMLENGDIGRIDHAHANLLGGRPYSRILLRIVRRLMPSIWRRACDCRPSIRASFRAAAAPCRASMCRQPVRSAARLLRRPRLATAVSRDGFSSIESAPRTGPAESASARRMKFSSSRMFPGQS